MCIAAHNEESTIAGTIRSVAAQHGSRITEILVCTNGCTDATEAVVRRLCGEIPTVRAISLAEAGKPRAWNVLFQEARAPVVVFADADVLLASDAVRRLVCELETMPRTIAVGARPVPLTAGLPPLRRFMARPPTAIGSLIGRLYAVRRARLLCEMAELGRPAMPSEVIADDGWVTLVAGRTRWREAPGALVYHLPPAISELPETYRRNLRGIRQLKALMPERYRAQRERPGHRYRRWIRELLSANSVAYKVHLVLTYLAHTELRVLARLQTAFESPEAWPPTWRVASASKDGRMMMAAVRGAGRSGGSARQHRCACPSPTIYCEPVSMDFRSRLVRTLRAIQPVLRERGVMVAGSEVPNLLEPDARSSLLVSLDVDIAVPVECHAAVKALLRGVRELTRSAEEPSVWLPQGPDLIEVNFIGIHTHGEQPDEAYLLEDSELPLLVFPHLSFLQPGKVLDIEGVTVPLPRPAGLLLEKLLTDRSGEKGDRDLLVALAVLLVCEAVDLEELEALYRELPPELRYAARSGLTTLSLLEPRAQMPDPAPHRARMAGLLARLEGTEQEG